MSKYKSKYIKLQDALNVCRLKPIIENGTTTGVGYPTPEEIVKALSDLPTIEVSEDCISRAEGEWITEKDSCEIICNKCGCEAFSKYGDWFETDYCPNCGAKMKG